MWVKTINALCWFLDISNSAIDLKKRLIKVVFGVALLSALTIGSGFAGVWIDENDFENSKTLFTFSPFECFLEWTQLC